jgi:hypothetical protein
MFHKPSIEIRRKHIAEQSYMAKCDITKAIVQNSEFWEYMAYCSAVRSAHIARELQRGYVLERLPLALEKNRGHQMFAATRHLSEAVIALKIEKSQKAKLWGKKKQTYTILYDLLREGKR